LLGVDDHQTKVRNVGTIDVTAVSGDLQVGGTAVLELLPATSALRDLGQ
jgi:hypothetical protein